MNGGHSLLRRQWKREFGDRPVPPEWESFIAAVDAAYRESDQGRAMLERSLELSSQELLQANAQMRAMLQAIPDLLFRIDAQGQVLDFKAAMGDELALSGSEVVGRRIQDVLAAHEPGDPLGDAIRRARQWNAIAYTEYSVRQEARDCFCEARVVPLGGEQLIVIVRNIDARRRAERLRIGQNVIFEMIASGTPLRDQLTELARLIETQVSGARCGILLADASGTRLEFGVAPSMPPEFAAAAADGVPIAEGSGSCGAAAFRKKPVIVADAETDPLWHAIQDFARRFGIAASCSMPVMSHQDTVVATVALYFSARHQATEEELHLLNLGAHIAGVAIQRKRAEEELFNSRQMLRTVLDTIPQRVFWKNRQLKFAGCNKALAEDRRYADPSEIVGKSDFDSVVPEIAERYRADDQQVMETDQPKINYEEPQIGVGGGPLRWLKTSKVPLHDKNGAVIGVLGTYEDITDRKLRDEALRRAEDNYRNIVENAVEGIFQCTPPGRIIQANPAFARMLGFDTPAQAMVEISSMRDQLFVEPERHDAFIRALDEHEVVQRFETRMRRRDSRIMWISLNVRRVLSPNGAILYYEGFAEDITDRKQLEEQFLQSQKMEAFGQLAGGIAHDFNNILTVIRVSASLLKDDRLNPVERAAAIIETLHATDRATNLTRQLLTFSRRHPIQTEPLDLNEIVARMTTMFKRLIGEHITLEAHYAPGAVIVRADGAMLEQAMMNLAVNSRDAMPKGGRLILRTSVETLSVDAERPAAKARSGEFVRLTVSDTGVGIAPEHLPHIFEPFFTTKDVGRGTGLGLATVFGIVDQHGGWIEVESAPGAGATFHLFLPRIAEASLLPADPVAPAPIPRGSETILLAEDEADVRTLMKSMLERFGYHVLAARSGVAALDMWQRRRNDIDLLVTDMVMPEGMTGSELAERLTADKPGLKVIYCSGYSDEVLGRDSPLRSSPNFIEKPFDVDVFLRRIRQCLDAKNGNVN